MNGGMQRCFNILHQLSKHANVHAIIHQDVDDFNQVLVHFPALSKVRFYSTKNRPAPTDLFSFLPKKLANALRYRWVRRSVVGSTDSNFLLYHKLLQEVLLKEKFDCIILENLATVNAVSLIRRLGVKVPIIYDAHNVDSSMASVAMQRKMIHSTTARAIESAEKNIYKKVNAILACSEKDKQSFKDITKNRVPVVVIPNAVNLPRGREAVSILPPSFQYIIFCGSLDYYPNTEAVSWLYEKIWPSVTKQFASCRLLLLGGGKIPNPLQNLNTDPTVHVAGRVKDLEPYYNIATLSVAPIITGSGTRLKILEAMSYGLPVISTTKGAEGIEYTENLNIVIAQDDQHFIDAICTLLRDKEKGQLIGSAARELIKTKYNWDKVGENLSNFLASFDTSEVALPA